MDGLSERELRKRERDKRKEEVERLERMIRERDEHDRLEFVRLRDEKIRMAQQRKLRENDELMGVADRKRQLEEDIRRLSASNREDDVQSDLVTLDRYDMDIRTSEYQRGDVRRKDNGHSVIGVDDKDRLERLSTITMSDFGDNDSLCDEQTFRKGCHEDIKSKLRRLKLEEDELESVKSREDEKKIVVVRKG